MENNVKYLNVERMKKQIILENPNVYKEFSKIGVNKEDADIFIKTGIILKERGITKTEDIMLILERGLNGLQEIIDRK